MSFPQDFWQEAKYFFQAPTEYDQAVVSKKWTPEAGAALTAYANALPGAADASAEALKALFSQTMEAQGLKPGQVLQLLRVAATGSAAGPDLFETLAILGTAEVSARLHKAVAALG